METLSRILFILGALPTFGGIVILLALASKPRGVIAHLQGVARVLMVAGSIFGIFRTLFGWVPPVDVAALVFGLGIGMALYARENHLFALAQERLEKAQAGR